MERCISPLPQTRKESELSVSLTRKDTSRKSSLYSLSRSCLVVTNFPSFPANGLSLTEKVISTVGSSILTNWTGSTLVGSHTVSPIFNPSIPENTTMSPACAVGTDTLSRPSI